MIKYKGYIGHYSFNVAQKLFMGRVANTHHLLTFEGKSIKELRENFEKVIDEHIEWGRKYGKNPEIPISLNE